MPTTNPGRVESIPEASAIELRVRYCECDPMGVAHHASFVPWLEMARTEALRASGRTYAQMEASGVFLVVTKLEVSYRRPARYDDVLRIVCGARVAGRARLEHRYLVELAQAGDGNEHRLNDQPLARATTELACVDASGRPSPLPEWLIGVVGRSA